jgi:hypothetical protein
MGAWSAKPVSAAILHRQSDPLVMGKHAARARNSARNTDAAIPYAAVNPRDTVSRAKTVYCRAHTNLRCSILGQVKQQQIRPIIFSPR